MTDRRCRWMRAFGWPTGFASTAAVIGGLVWRIERGPWVTDWRVHEFAIWLFMLEWVVLFVIVVVTEVAYQEPPPADPEPRQSNVTIYDPPDVNNMPRRFERTGPRSAILGPGLPAGISKRHLERWIAYVWDTRNETDSRRRVTFSVRWARELDIEIADADVSNVKRWLESAGWIRVKGNEQTELLDAGRVAFRRIVRHGFDVLGDHPPTDEEA